MSRQAAQEAAAKGLWGLKSALCEITGNRNAQEEMVEKQDHLYILWTTDNPVTAENMVFMYGFNSLKHGWWEKVTIIIWGASAKLVSENAQIQESIRKMTTGGVTVTACKSCSDQLGVTEKLENMGIGVKYWGKPLTDVLKAGEKLLTI